MVRLAALAAVFSLSAAAGELSELERTVVHDAQAVLQRRVPGGQHCATKVAGSFANLADSGLRRLAELKRSLLKDEPYEEAQDFRRIAAGRETGTATPRQWLWLEAASSPAREVRQALCTETGTLARPLMLFGGWAEEEPYDHFDLRSALLIGHFEARQEADVIRRVSLLQSACLDSLAAANTVAPHSLIGRMFAGVIVTDAFEGCQEVINHSNQEGLVRLSGIMVALSARSPFSEVLRDERVFGQLVAFHDSYSSEALAQLPSQAGVLIGWAKSQPAFLYERPFAADARHFVFGRWARKRHFEQMEEAIRATGLPLEQAVVRLKELHQDVPLAITLLGQDRGVSDGFAGVLQRAVDHDSVVQMLLAAVQVRLFRLRHGVWPKSLDPVAKEFNLRAAGSLTLQMTEDGPLLELKVPAFPESQLPTFLLKAPVPSRRGPEPPAP